jgi:hypothetical protein
MTFWIGKLNAWDAENTDGLNCKGYSGVGSDGEHLYYSPFFDGSIHHGRVLCQKIFAPFKLASSWEAYDAGATDGLTSKGFWGNSIFDGQFVYFAPYNNGSPSGIVLRHDPSKPFKSSSSWEAYDAGSVDGLTTKGFLGAVFDGQFIYFVPYYNGAYSGIFLRYDTTKPFKAASSWEAYDAGSLASGAAKGFCGAVVDEDFIYFSPYKNASGDHGNILRLDRRLPFKSSSAWAVFAATGVHANCKGFGSPTSDGIFVYFPNYSKDLILRYDTTKPFAAASSYEYFDLATIDPFPEIHDCCFTYDHYVVFSPYRFSMLAYDRDLPFSDPGAWAFLDCGHADNLDAWGNLGVHADPNYFYFAPFRRYDEASQYHGTVLRARINPCPNQSQPAPGSEDLSKYAEDDLAGIISKSSSRATASSLETGLLALCYFDYGKDSFNALEIDFNCRLTAASCEAPDYNEVEHGILSLSNNHSTIEGYWSTDDPFVTFFAEFEDGDRLNQYLRLHNHSIGSYYAISLGTTYYCTLLRSAGSGTVQLKIYSNAERTNLLATLTETGFATTRTWRYIYALRSGDLGPGDDHMSFYIENINVISH